MKQNRIIILILIGLLFIPPLTSMTISEPFLSKDALSTDVSTSRTTEQYWRHIFPEGYPENTALSSQPTENTPIQLMSPTEEKIGIMTSNPMDSAWPMYNHDVRHTGLSPYSTVDNPLTEKWRYPLSWSNFYSGSILDHNNTIICGADILYGIYPNGTEKWRYTGLGRPIESTPAIDKKGIIYIGTIWGQPNYLHAVDSTNGKLKWKYPVGNSIDSSPAIGSDGTIYFGDWSGTFHTVNPDGTKKWTYQTGDVITSSPGIDDDGTIYIGSHDDYVYAFYPNGTVKWRFQTGAWVHASPTIGQDGTIYIGSDDGYLYALNPSNGSMIWKCSIGYSWCSPSLGPDGTLYLGVWNMYFYAIRPNGTIKWTYNAPGRIWFGSSATVSSDGTIYFGTTTQDGGAGAFIALNPDGTERYKNTYGYFATSPAIAEDGTIYALSFNYAGMTGMLHAFGRGELRADAGGPYTGYAGERFTVSEMIYGGVPPYTCCWDFGDGNTSTEQHPTHIYKTIGNYTITLTVIDSQHNTSIDYATITLTYGPPHATLVKPKYGIYFANVKLISLDSPRYLIFGRITLIVNASHPVAGIDHVDFYIDGTLRYTDTAPPYSYVWKQRYSKGNNHYIRIIVVSTVGTLAERNYDMWKIF